jgi:hypothetical protein
LDSAVRDAVEFRERAEEVWDASWKEMRDDLAFLAGDQWPAAVLAARERDARPTLTLNRLPQFVDQVIGDSRQNNISLRAIAAGEDTQFKTTDGRSLRMSTVVAGLLRNIEQNSKATQHYENALEWAAKTGLGFLRVRTEWGQGMSQDILIESIANPFAVIYDPDTQQPNGSDAKRCLVLTEMQREDYKRKYPGADEMSFEGSPQWAIDRRWVGDKTVTVAEHLWIDEKPDTLLLLSNRKLVYKSDVEDVLDELKASGVTVVKDRPAKRPKVYWTLLNGVEQLEAKREIPCKHLPVVPVFGKSEVVEGKTIYRGVIRFAKDAQRQYNYQQSAATERVALSPKAPFIAGLSQMGNMRKEWESANVESRAVLVYDDSQNVQPPQRQGAPQIPGAELALAAQGAENLHATTGIYPASLGARSNETSGRAIQLRQNEGDTGTFAYHDNLARAVELCGQIAAEMIPVVYDTDRVLRVCGADGTVTFLRVNQPIVDEQTGTEVKVNDLSTLECDVVVTTGPAFITQRMEAVNALIEFTRINPNIAPVVMDVMARNMDWPGSEELSVRLRAMLPPELRQLEEAPDGQDPALAAANAQAVQLAEALGQRDKMIAEMKVALEKMQAMAAEAEATRLNDQTTVSLQGMMVAIRQVIDQTAAGNQAIAQMVAAGNQSSVEAFQASMQLLTQSTVQAQEQSQQQFAQVSMALEQMAGWMAQYAQVQAQATASESASAEAVTAATMTPTRKVVEMQRIGDGRYRAVIEESATPTVQ